jgi:hypothetical protein
MILEGFEGQEKRFQRGQFSSFAESLYKELQQARVKMGRAICDQQKDMASGLSPCESSRTKVGAFVEC